MTDNDSGTYGGNLYGGKANGSVPPPGLSSAVPLRPADRAPATQNKKPAFSGGDKKRIPRYAGGVNPRHAA